MRSLPSLATVTSLLVLATAACGPAATRDGEGDPRVDGGGGDDGALPPGVDAPPTQGCTKIDVLFVIDNSGSMGQEQTNLIANFPAFIQVLDASGLDYRVGVTTTGRNYSYAMAFPIGGTIPMSITDGDNGRLLQPAGCNMTSPWISRGDANAATTFSCLANVGTGGPSDEMPLGAVRDAFEDRITDGTNAGFRRADALLGVVMLTDENDCSYEQSVTLGFSESLCDDQMEPVGNYVAFLNQYTGNATRWATAVIAGPGPGACSSTFGDAAEATRLKEFVTQVGPNAIMSSICEGDLSQPLASALALFQNACGGVIF